MTFSTHRFSLPYNSPHLRVTFLTLSAAMRGTRMARTVLFARITAALCCWRLDGCFLATWTHHSLATFTLHTCFLHHAFTAPLLLHRTRFAPHPSTPYTPRLYYATAYRTLHPPLCSPNAVRGTHTPLPAGCPHTSPDYVRDPHPF